MKKWLFLIFILFSGPINAIDLPEIENIPFKVGESYTYALKYEFFVAGRATLEVKEGPLMNGRPTFHFVSTAKSNKFVDVFFKVRDYNSSTVDQKTLASFRMHQNLREGRYRVMRDTTFDYDNNTYTYERTYKGKTTVRKGAIEGPASDILSAFFYVRTLPLELGKSYEVKVVNDKQTYTLRVDVHRKLKTVRVGAGKFECLRLRPFVIGDAIFKAKNGKMYIWLTNDERKMPVMIRSRVAVGAFDAELLEYNN